MNTKTAIGTITGSAAATTAAVLLFTSSASVPAFKVTAITRVAGTTWIQFNSQTNTFYHLRACTNVKSPTWVELKQEVLGNGGVSTLSDTTAEPQKFYRVVGSQTSVSSAVIPPYPPGTLKATNSGGVL